MLTQRLFTLQCRAMNREPLYNFKYTVTLPDGRVIQDGTLAHTEWHAVDKAIFKYADQQPDRTKYVAKRHMDIVVR